MRKLLCICFILLAWPSAGSQLPAGFVEKLIAQNLDPTDMVIAPDGRIFITIKSGKILIIENGILSTSLLLTLSVDNFNERGLGHIVLDPNFNSNNYYYVYYTVPNSNFNRVSRFTANGNSTLPGSEFVLLDLDVLSGTIHNAGDMAFGLDGKLYIASGD
jgi:glucose/arabinose dehydrogenase